MTTLRTLILSSLLALSGTFTSARPIEGGETMVYICVTGKVYHSDRDCRGLNNAKHEIKKVPLSKAKVERRTCKICY